MVPASACWAHRHMQARTELAQRLLESNPTIRSICTSICGFDTSDDNKQAGVWYLETNREFPILSCDLHLPLHCLFLLNVACIECQSTGLGCCKNQLTFELLLSSTSKHANSGELLNTTEILNVTERPGMTSSSSSSPLLCSSPPFLATS